VDMDIDIDKNITKIVYIGYLNCSNIGIKNLKLDGSWISATEFLMSVPTYGVRCWQGDRPPSSGMV
jgi:hypothetical protein